MTNSIIQLSVALMLIMIVSTATAQELKDADSLRCTFPWSAVAAWEGGAVPKIRVNSEKSAFEFHVDAIDGEKKTARLIGNVGVSDGMVVPLPGGLQVVESVPGGMNVLSVSRSLIENTPGAFRAVYSRHASLELLQIASQYYGTCKVWN